jgi:hypothetical protein
MLTVAWFIGVGPTIAQTQQDWASCLTGDLRTPDVPIDGTAVIRAGRQGLRKLATAYNNRGVAYRTIGKYAEAISDLSEGYQVLKPGGATTALCWKRMPISQDDFNSIAAVVDWLDACRRRDLDALLDLYDDGAVLECNCEGVTFCGKSLIADYWAPKLEKRGVSAFSLDDVVLIERGVRIDYQSYESKPVRFYFRFGAS